MKIIYEELTQEQNHPRGRHEAGLRLLRGLLGQLGVTADISYEPSGQPICRDADGAVCSYVSIAHCDGMVVAAVHEYPVGVDVECLEREVSEKRRQGLSVKLFQPALTEKSVEDVSEGDEKNCSPVRSFLVNWTRHEAYGKMLGTGLQGAENWEISEDAFPGACKSEAVEGLQEEACGAATYCMLRDHGDFCMATDVVKDRFVISSAWRIE